MARQSLLSVVLGLKADKFEAGLTRAQRKLSRTANDLSQIGRGLSLGVTAPLAAIGVSSFKVAADFELAMKKVKAVSGATGAEFDKLEKNALDLGKSTVFSASSIAQLQLEMAKLGLSSDEIVKATDSTLALAQAFGNDLGPTAETVVKTINQFGLQADEAGRVADVMATAFGASALDLEKFAGSMGNVAPIAKEFGFSLEETTALLGVLANNGIEGTDAGTKLKMAFSQLAAEGVNVKDTFTAIINGSVTYKDAIDLLGKRAAILSPIFGKNTDELGELGKELLTAEGRAKSMSKEMDDSAKGGIAAMQSALEGAQIQIGNALAPVVLDIINKITEMAQAFGNLSKETQKTIVKVGALAAALGPLLSVGSGVTRVALNLSRGFGMLAKKGFTANMRFKRMAVVIRNIGRVVKANPIGLLVTAITSVTALAIPFISKMGRMSDAQRELTEETRSANLEIAKQVGHLRTALNLEVNMASANELRQGIQQITQELDNFNAAALSSQVEVDFGGEGGGVRVKDIGAIGDQLSPLLQKELGQKLNDQISFLTAQAISQGLFGDNALAFIQGNMQKVVDSTVNNFRSGLEGRRSEMQEALAAMLEPDGGDDSGLDNLLGGSDETVDDLFKMLENFGHFTELTTDKIKRQFNEAIETLQVQSGLGIIDDLTLAQSALAEIENALTNSVLADPNFINTEQFALLNEQMTKLKELLAENKTEVKEVNDALFNSAQMGNLAGELIGAGFQTATDGTQTFGQAVSNIFQNAIMQAIKSAIANAINLAFQPTPDNVASGGLAAPAKAAGLVAGIKALFAKIPKLHDGGMTLGPQLALIGDNPSGREAVIPMERMGSFLNQVAGTNQNMNVMGRLHGSDILLSEERAKRNRGR